MLLFLENSSTKGRSPHKSKKSFFLEHKCAGSNAYAFQLMEYTLIIQTHPQTKCSKL